MLRIFYLLINFYTMFLVCAQLQPSLNQMIVCFEQFKKGYGNNIPQLRKLHRYQQACKKALTELASDKTRSHVWYRVEFARVLYSLWFATDNDGIKNFNFALQVFQENIEPLFYNWNALKNIKEMNYLVDFHKESINNMPDQWSFFNFYYRSYQVLQCADVLEQGYRQRYPDSPRFEELEKMPSERLDMFYYSKQESDHYALYLRSENDSSAGHCLLIAPKNGLVFFGGPYYGALDYENKKVFICKRSNNETTVMDFSSDMNWYDFSSIKCANVVLKERYLVFIFNFFNFQSKEVFYYRFINNPDLSIASNYY